MGKRKLTGRQWAVILILSYCGALALSMRFPIPKLPASQQVNALTEIVWNLRNSLSETSVDSTLLFGGLVGLAVLVHQMKQTARPPRLLLPVSFLIALVWLMGASFSINNTLESLDSSPGQIVKSGCYVAGSTYLLYELGQLLFSFLEQKDAEKPKGQGKLARIYREHPFWVSFFAILLFWLPHLIIAYPGYISFDSWYQITQFFGTSTFTALHPPITTFYLGLSIRLGLMLGNANIGLYLFIIFQTVVAVLVFAYTLFVMKKWRSPQWLRTVSFGAMVFVPYYTNYAVSQRKDFLYSIWFLLFVLEAISMLEKGTDYFTNWKHDLLLVASIMGTIHFRNNGKHVLYPTMLAILAYFWINGRKKEKKDLLKPIIFFLGPVLAANLLSMAVMEHYNVTKSGLKEALSFPFQQTARYVLERGDEVTKEEAEAIRAVLDYDHLAENYDPRISDPVKNTYKKGVTNRELLRYFVVWGKMFFKHPEIYFKATMNQNYYLLYPFQENILIYDSTVLGSSSSLYDRVDPALGIAEVKSLKNPRTTMKGIYYSGFSLPVIGMFSHPAPYCILLIFLIVFAIHKKLWRLIIVMFPLALTAVVVVLAPTIQKHPRFALPIIYSMPIIVAYYIHLKKTDPKQPPAAL